MPPPPAIEPYVAGAPAGQFKAKDYGYLDPDNSLDFVEVKEHYNIYHNVYAFTHRIRIKAANPAARISLTQNLDVCLLGAAAKWYTNELDDVTRRMLQRDTSTIESWCEVLEQRFREAPGVSLDALLKETYTTQDVRDGKNPMDLISNIALHGKNTGIAPDDYSQMLLAYRHIEAVLRRDLICPTRTTTMANFTRDLREAHTNWRDIYRPRTGLANLDTRRQDRSSDRNRRYSQYNNSHSNPSRFLSQQAQSPANNYSKKEPYSQKQLPPPEQQSARKAPLQITAGHASTNQWRGRTENQKLYDQRRTNEQGRRYNNSYSNPQAQTQGQQRAYHGQIDEEDEADDEQEDYDGAEEEHNEELPDDEVEAHFVATMFPPRRPQTCRRCLTAFDSGNALHRHLPTCIGTRSSGTAKTYIEPAKPYIDPGCFAISTSVILSQNV
jgi:hypothetical protein